MTRGEELPALANRVSRICFAAAVCIIMAELFRSALRRISFGARLLAVESAGMNFETVCVPAEVRIATR